MTWHAQRRRLALFKSICLICMFQASSGYSLGSLSRSGQDRTALCGKDRISNTCRRTMSGSVSGRVLPIAYSGSQCDDVYPSRQTLPSAMHHIERLDPVVHGWNLGGPLSRDQMSAYERDGFLVIEDVLSKREVDELQRSSLQMMSDPDLRQTPSIVLEPQGDNVRSVYSPEDFSRSFSELVSNEKIVASARQILGGHVYLYQSRLNCKPGNGGIGFPWHSDFETWHVEDGMPRMRALSATVFLADNTPANGPVLFAPGTQGSFIPRFAIPDGDRDAAAAVHWGGEIEKKTVLSVLGDRGVQAATGKAGSLLLFDCNVLHCSENNTEKEARINYFAVFNSIENQPIPSLARLSRPEYISKKKAIKRL